MGSPFDPATNLLGIYPKQNDECTRLFTAAYCNNKRLAIIQVLSAWDWLIHFGPSAQWSTMQPDNRVRVLCPEYFVKLKKKKGKMKMQHICDEIEDFRANQGKDMTMR